MTGMPAFLQWRARTCKDGFVLWKIFEQVGKLHDGLPVNLNLYN